jgi:circadian clock protein KaiC
MTPVMDADQEITKLATFIPGFEHIADGGLPLGRTTLVAGSAGSAKSVFAAQFLAGGIAHAGEAGVFVTFEEPPAEISRNMRGCGWDFAAWERQGLLAFVDASPQPDDELSIVGDFDLAALIARIEYAVRKTGAKRLCIDSLGAVFSFLADSAVVRREIFRLVSRIKQLGVTTLLTAERVGEHGQIARHGVEEFVTDNVIILRNVLDGEQRRRTVEVLKFRGTSHRKGEYPFTVVPGQGIHIIPLSAIELKQESSDERISSGNAELDAMCGGGIFRDSVVLVSGATGTGKTLIATEFMAAGASRSERCLMFAFEESRQQLFRNAAGWGVDLERLEHDGLLRVVCAYPESAGIEDHLISIKSAIQQFRPTRVAVDSLSAIERASSTRGFREFTLGLTSYIKEFEIAGLFTAATPMLFGNTSILDSHTATMTDSIILLRYLEVFGEMRRGLAVLKMRGSAHDKDIRELSIDGAGLHVGRPLREVTGILSGNSRHATIGEIEAMGRRFDP